VKSQCEVFHTITKWSINPTQGGVDHHCVMIALFAFHLLLSSTSPLSTNRQTKRECVEGETGVLFRGSSTCLRSYSHIQSPTVEKHLRNQRSAQRAPEPLLFQLSIEPNLSHCTLKELAQPASTTKWPPNFHINNNIHQQHLSTTCLPHFQQHPFITATTTIVAVVAPCSCGQDLPLPRVITTAMPV